MNRRLAVGVIVAACLACGSCWGADRAIFGPWGLKFGQKAEESAAQMKENGASLVFDTFAYRIGVTSLYQGEFFGRSCFAQLFTNDRGLWRVQMSFKRPEIQAGSGQNGNYFELSKLLTDKYGSPKTITTSHGEARQWKDEDQMIELTADNRSESNYTTVLTYTDRRRYMW